MNHKLKLILDNLHYKNTKHLAHKDIVKLVNQKVSWMVSKASDLKLKLFPNVD